MGKKKTQQEVYEFLKNKGYNLLEEYKKNNIPIQCEKNGYFYKVRFDNLQVGKNPTLWGTFNIDNLEHNVYQYLKEIHSESIYLGFQQIIKSNNKRILIKFRCSCGQEFNKTVDKMISDKYICCHNCALRFRGRSQRKGSDKIIKFIESKGFVVLDKSKDYLTSEYIEVQDELGYLGFVKESKLKQSIGMSRFDVRINRKNYIHNVNVWAKSHCASAICLGFSEKQYNTQALQFQCHCGYKFITSISSFQNGKIQCDNCSKRVSSYEKIFENYLIENNIEYIYQYSFNQCRDVLPLPFDFYLPKYNLLIEIDGEGHYHPCNFNQISQEDAEKTFKITLNHDKIKNNFCKENNYSLLRIPYTAFNMHKEYQTIFSQFTKA